MNTLAPRSKDKEKAAESRAPDSLMPMFLL